MNDPRQCPVSASCLSTDDIALFDRLIAQIRSNAPWLLECLDDCLSRETTRRVILHDERRTPLEVEPLTLRHARGVDLAEALLLTSQLDLDAFDGLSDEGLRFWDGIVETVFTLTLCHLRGIDTERLGERLANSA